MNSINIPNALISLAKIFKEHGYDLYLIGGYVRNQLLGLPSDSIDIASPATPKQVAEILRTSKNTRVIQDRSNAGSLEIQILYENKHLTVDHISFRKDLYNYTKPLITQQVQFTINPYEDAARRDFTVNCIYYDILNKTYFDPYNGIEDIKNRILRSITANPLKIIETDAIRILRMARFSCQLGLAIDYTTFSAAQTNASALKGVAKDRIIEELNRILMGDTVYPPLTQDVSCVEKGLNMLNVLKVWEWILPHLSYTSEMAKLCGTVEPRLPLRLAALITNAAKVKPILGEEGLGYNNKIVEEVFNIHQAKKYINKSSQETAFALAHLPIDALIDAGRLWSEPLYKTVLQIKENGGILSMDQLAVSGKDIMYLTPAKGKQIALIKNRLFQYAVLHPESNNYETLSVKTKDIFNDYMKEKEE